MKKITQICALLCTALVLPVVNAQEYTRDISFISSGGTAFACRQNNQKWIFCNTDTARCAQFVQVDTTSSSAPCLSIDDLHFLTDAKTLDSRVYFSGDAGSVGPVFGYFNEIGFPSVSVEYVTYSVLSTITRVEPFFDGTNRHVILIGKDANNVSCLVDAFHDPAYGTMWTSYKGDDGSGVIYDDIAVTSEKIIVSARESNSNTGYIYVFGKPQYTGTIFSATTPQRFQLANDVHSTILLSQAGANKYMAVYSSSSNGSAVVIKELDNMTYLAGGKFHYSGKIPSGANFLIKEVYYSNLSNSVDIIVQDNLSGGQSSTVWNVNHSQLASLSTLYGHHYAGIGISSIAHATLNSTNVIAAAISPSNTMRAIRFVDNMWGSCATQKIQDLSNETMTVHPEEPTFTSFFIQKQQGTFQTSTCNVSVSTICTD